MVHEDDDLEPDGPTQPEVEVLSEASDLLTGFYEPTPPPRLKDDLPEALEPLVTDPGEWVEAEAHDGDGPFPVDAQAPASGPNAFSSAGPWVPRAETLRGTGQDPEVRMERRMRARADVPPSPKASPRRYPLFRARLQNPELVPEGSEAIPEPLPPPVPGTFIPRPPPPPPRTEPTELDAMLALMADGLFIREGEDGATEIRVTLRDEYFAGTELRIALEGGQIRATLVPPSREVYWQLGGEAHQLRDRLEQRGLRVSELTVVEPAT